jgi:hypothetical protein
MFVGEARSLPLSGTPEKGFNRVGSGLTCKGWKDLPRTNALAYYKKVVTYGRKSSGMF